MMKLLLGTHAEIREFLINYLEGQLPLLKRLQFRVHLLFCGKCNDYLRKYDTSVKLSRHYLQDPPPAELIELTIGFLGEHIASREGEGGPDPVSTP
jgi:hypothetical protein